MNKVIFDEDLKSVIKNTVTNLAKAVKSTLGPAGTNVMVLSPIKLPIIINDGVTVANSFVTSLTEEDADSLETRIAQLIREIAKNTESLAGDGTTTSITLAEAIILEGLKAVEITKSPVNVARGIHEATKIVLQLLEEQTIPVSEDKSLLRQVARISANNDKELGDLIANAFSKVTVDGQIEVKDSENEKTYIDIVKGMKYDCGFESNMFVNNSRGEAILDDCKILIYEGKLESIDPIIPIMKQIRGENLSLLVIADDYSIEAVNDLAHNKVRAHLKVCAVKSPGYGIAKEGNIEDISIVTSAKVISDRFGSKIDDVEFSDLGTATSVKVDVDSFAIITDTKKSAEVTDKVAKLKLDLKKAKSPTEKDEISDRIARLVNGVAILYVAGDSDVEVSDKKYRIEDAIHATRASLEEGVVVGGGVTLLKLGNELKMPQLENQDQELGFKVLKNALEAPIRTICANVDVSGDIIIDTILKSKAKHYGYDAKNKEFTNLVKAGVLDPKKVTRTALANASSVAQLMLTMNTAIC